MVQNANIFIEMPGPARRIRLPKGVNDRLQRLLDRQDRGEKLTAAEKREADGLVELAELLSLMRLRSEKAARNLRG
ncbi:MAG: hypothetical protein HOP17_16130 [Acidobacteria bacterium]|nr:hypothetical protein [Acidobacteriota bacterium]